MDGWMAHSHTTRRIPSCRSRPRPRPRDRTTSILVKRLHQPNCNWAGLGYHCTVCTNQRASSCIHRLLSCHAMPTVIVWTQGIQGQGTGRKKQTTNKGQHSRSDTRAKSKTVPSPGTHIGRRQAKMTMACRVLAVHAVRCFAVRLRRVKSLIHISDGRAPLLESSRVLGRSASVKQYGKCRDTSPKLRPALPSLLAGHRRSGFP